MTIGPPGESPPSGALDRDLVRGIAWTSGTKWFAQALSWASMLVLARILARSDFGLYGMATVFIGLVDLMNEMGLGAAIIRDRHLTEAQVSRLGGVAILAGLVFAGLSVLLAGRIAAFYHESAVGPVIRILSLTFITGAIQTVPRSLLNRDRAFRTLGVIDLAEGLTLTVTTLALALAGWSYWALALGLLTSRCVSTVLLVWQRPHRIVFPSTLKSVRDEIRFGGHVVGSRIAWYAYSNADFVVVGRTLGAAAQGAYTIGWQLANIPVDRISALLSRVAPAIFSAVQDDDAALRRYLRGLCEALAFITFPAAAGLALTADDLVHVALGAKWEAAIWPLRLLAMYAGLRSVTTLFPHILIAKGEARRAMTFSVIAALVMPLLFIAGSRWGLPGVAAAWIVGYPIVALPFVVRDSLRLIGMRWSEYLGALAPAALASSAMIAGVLALRSVLTEAPDALRLAAEVVAGAAVYGLMLVTVERKRLVAARELIRSVRR